VADRDTASMTDETRAALCRLARACPCVVISGRSLSDVRRRLEGAPTALVFGNHGLEPSAEARRAALSVTRWLLPVSRVAAGFAGVAVEDKRLSLSVHFRGATRRRAARAAVRRVARGLPGLRLVKGKEVLNLVPAEAPGKGIALERAWRRLCCRSAVYVGDDDTDEDVFSLARAALLTIRVGPSRRSAAQYYLRDQEEVAPMLLQLAAFVEDHGTRRGR
jgi:trehalose 6-phosphate phosphatase